MWAGVWKKLRQSATVSEFGSEAGIHSYKHDVKTTYDCLFLEDWETTDRITYNYTVTAADTEKKPQAFLAREGRYNYVKQRI